MSLQHGFKLSQWISDNWLAGVSEDEIAMKMHQQGCSLEVIENMQALLAGMEDGMYFYSEAKYGLQLIEMHATRGGMAL